VVGHLPLPGHVLSTLLFILIHSLIGYPHAAAHRTLPYQQVRVPKIDYTRCAENIVDEQAHRRKARMHSVRHVVPLPSAFVFLN
jgi:hypothetical protein